MHHPTVTQSQFGCFIATFSQKTNSSNSEQQLQCLQEILKAILSWPIDKESVAKDCKRLQSVLSELEDILKVWNVVLLYKESQTMIEVNS